MIDTHFWWQTGVVYQIYPRSFMDGTGDGTGDLPGVISRLDYLRDLGIDAIWLSPIFPSPMADFGYDVSDYTAIEPLFGTLHDFDTLIAEAGTRGMRVLLDLVPNHSSDEHPWFVESRSSRDNPRRDWYIWRDPARTPSGQSGPPNNWVSHFGGSAWELDETTGQYYLHLFDKKQPDLNWRNPDVRTAIYDAMRFWLDRGVAGFRVDVIWMMIKDAEFRDNPPDPDAQPHQRPVDQFLRVYTEDQPEVHEIVREMRKLLDSYDARVMIGEIYLPVPKLVTYYGEALDEAHLPFNFQLILLQWNAQTVRAAVDEYETHLPPDAWPNWVLGNHDQPRVASRIGRAQARVANMLLLTLRGTPTCYYGDEIAMVNVPVPPELMHDPPAKIAPEHSRDPERTPMQWDSGPNAGFTTGVPWLPIADDYRQYNVAVEQDDPTSMLTLFRRLIALRRAESALTIGDYRSIEAGSAEVFVYLREFAGRRLLTVLNFGSAAQHLDLSAAGQGGTVLLSTHLDRSEAVELARLALRPDEGVVIAIG